MTPTDICLAAIAANDGALKAFTALDSARARADAELSARRIADGSARALEGWPIAVKANIAVAGLATTAGIAARRGAVATRDASVVAALRAAGAVILGHVNMHEGALGATTDNAAFGRTANPHHHGHSPGGSSGGSAAAVAAGLCRAAVGSDTLGSIRIPAAYCGIYGLKPGLGTVDVEGVVPLSPSLDCVGPLARSVADLAAIMAVIGTSAAAGPRTDAQPIRRVAQLDVVDAADMEPAVRAGYARAAAALTTLGIAVEPHAAPGIDLIAVRMGGFLTMARDAAAYYADAVVADGDGFSPGFRAVLAYGTTASAAVVAAGEAAMAAAAVRLKTVVDTVGAVLLPAVPHAAPPHGTAPVTPADFTALANVAGLPALALPAGRNDAGLPVGIQLIGPMGSEAALLTLGAALDAALGGYRAPPLRG